MNSTTCSHPYHKFGQRHSRRSGFSPIKRIRRWWNFRRGINSLELSEEQQIHWQSLKQMLPQLQQAFHQIRHNVMQDLAFNLGAPQGAQVITQKMLQDAIQQMVSESEAALHQLNALLDTLNREQRDKLLELLNRSG